MEVIVTSELIGLFHLFRGRKQPTYIQGGPLLVINGVINPINGLIIG